MSDNDVKAIKAQAEGRIQGVGYRANAHKRATQLGIKGYIRNISGNQVELVAEGTEKDLKELVDFLEEGPARAEIESFTYDWIEATNSFIRFSIKY